MKHIGFENVAMSPSAKRAWIEMRQSASSCRCEMVALCEEGVDRNIRQIAHYKVAQMSPSAKRAWIEISRVCCDVEGGIGRPLRRGRG